MSNWKHAYNLSGQLKRIRANLANDALIEDAEEGRLSVRQIAIKYGQTEENVTKQLDKAMIDPAAMPPDNTDFLRAAVRRGLQMQGVDPQAESEEALLKAVSAKQIEVYMDYVGASARLRKIVLDQISEMEQHQELAKSLANYDETLAEIPEKMRKALMNAINFANRNENTQTIISNLEKLAKVDQQIISLQGGPTPEDSRPQLKDEQLERLERLYERFATQGKTIRKAIESVAQKDVIDITPTEVGK